MPAEPQHVDEAQFGKLQKLMPATALASLLETFFHDAATRMDRLRKAVAAGDAGEIEQTAHSLKGSSGMLGFARMASLCASAEDAAETGAVQQVAGMLPGMQFELAELSRLMASMVPSFVPTLQ